MDLEIIRIIAFIILGWLLLILTGLILFGLFVTIGCCIKEIINFCKKNICCCIIYIENEPKKKKIELA